MDLLYIQVTDQILNQDTGLINNSRVTKGSGHLHRQLFCSGLLIFRCHQD